MRMRNAPGRGDGIFVGRVGHAESSGASKQMKGEREYRVRSEVKPGEPAYATESAPILSAVPLPAAHPWRCPAAFLLRCCAPRKTGPADTRPFPDETRCASPGTDTPA